MRSQIIVGTAVAALFAVGCSNEPAKSPEPQRSQFREPTPQTHNDPVEANMTPRSQTPATQPQGALPQPQPQSPAFDAPPPQKPAFASTSPATDSRVLAKTEKTLSDNEVFGVVITANEGEVEMAEVAAKKATHDEVKQFAGMMKAHHSAATTKAKTMGTKAKLSTADNEVSGYLKASTDETLKELRERDAGSFDKAYMDSQVKAHRDVLQAIDNRLMPAATNGELKSTLTEMRRVVSEHLTKAESIQKKLDGRASTKM